MHRTPLLRLSILCTLVAAAACGDDANPTGGTDGAEGGGDGTSSATTTTGAGGDPATIQDACEGRGNRDLACFQDPEFDVAGCVAAEACFRKIYRDDAEQPMLDCFAAWSSDADCNGPWCGDKVAATLTPSAAHTAHAAKCAAYEADCGGSAGDVCENPVIPLVDELVTIIGACLDGQCNDLEACLDADVGAYLASCGGDVGGLW